MYNNKRIILSLLMTILIVFSTIPANAKQPTLRDAIKNNDAKAAEDILKNLNDSYSSKEQKKSAIRPAVLSNNFEIVKLLLTHGIDINDYAHYFLNPAIYNKNYDMIKFLIKEGLNNDRLSSIGIRNAIDIKGTEEEKIKMLNFLLKEGATIIPSNNSNLLAAPIRNKNTKLIKMLVELGAEINTGTGNSMVPLILASRLNKSIGLETVSYLLSQGADPNFKDYTGNTALFRIKNLEIAKLLINNGANVNAKNDAGNTPLHSNLSYPSIVDLLIKSGADVNMKNNDGLTPILKFGKNNYGKNIDTIKKLKLNRADIHATDKNGNNFLIFAALSKHGEQIKPEFIKDLKAVGFDINYKNNHGQTALMLAFKPYTIKALIDNGANVNLIDNNGMTALMHTINNKNYTSNIKLLIDSGADINAKDSNGMTPLLYAAEKKKIDIAKLLTEAGADINAKSATGKSALEFLALNGIAVEEYKKNSTINQPDLNGWTTLMYSIFLDKENFNRVFEKIRHDESSRSSYERYGKRIWPGSTDKITKALNLGANPNIQVTDGRSVLSWAILALNYKVATKLLIENGGDPLLEDSDGSTPFMHALSINDQEIVSYILEYLPNDKINHQKTKGMTTLMQASIAFNSDAIKILIEKGADVKRINNRGQDTLTLVSHHCKPEITKLFIEKDADVNNISQFGESAIINSAYAGCTENMQLLLEAGADKETKNSKGETPIMVAAMMGHTDVVNVLIDNDANVKIKSNNGDTPLLATYNHGQFTIATQLLKAGANKSDLKKLDINHLNSAIKMGSLESVKKILSSRIDINDLDNRGYTPLATSIIYDKNDIVQFLISKKADTNKKSQPNKHSKVSPLDLATKHKNTTIIKALIKNGADISGEGKEGINPIITAVNTNSPDILKALLESGINIDFKDKDGRTALMYTVSPAAITECEEGGCWGPDIDIAKMAQTLLDNGANVNNKDNKGNTPLHYTAWRWFGSDNKLIDLLLKAGAEIDARNDKGNTPLLHSVAEKRHVNTELFSYLRENGADFFAVNNNGENVLLVAAASKSLMPNSVVNYMVNSGIDINSINKDGDNALILSLRETISNEETITALIKHGISKAGALSVIRGTRFGSSGTRDRIKKMLE